MSQKKDNLYQCLQAGLSKLASQRFVKHGLSHASKEALDDQGFALPLAVGMGLMMILVGMTMIARSQNDQITASAQKITSRSLGATETGITRAQAAFKAIPSLLEQNSTNWQNSCASTNNASLNSFYSSLGDFSSGSFSPAWIRIDSSDAEKGEYKVLDYTYSNNEGILRVQGKAKSENNSSNLSINNSTTVLRVRIPVLPNPNFIALPGIAAQNFSMGNNQVNGSILVYGCSIPSGVSEENIIDGTGNLYTAPLSTFPKLPPLPTPIISVSKGLSNNDFPNTKGCIYDSEGYVVNEEGAKFEPQTKVCKSAFEVKTSTLAFPRSGDSLQDSEGYYNYLIGLDPGSAGNSIRMTGGTKLAIEPGKKVRFFLQGNISMSGRTELISTGAPENFQIYGSDGGNNYKVSGDTQNYTTTSVVLSGKATANMLIFAPNATIGVNGGGSSAFSIYGSVIANTWDASSANQVVVAVPPSLDLSIFSIKPKISGSLKSWERRQVAN